LIAAVRLFALREMMRFEMPERVSDFMNPPIGCTSIPAGWAGNTTPIAFPTNWPDPGNAAWCQDVKTVYMQMYPNGIPVPSVALAYQRRYNASATANLKYESSACLYLTVTLMGGSESRKQFNESEIGDADKDSLPEFADGWGNPIKYLRWAPGFSQSDVQWKVPAVDAVFFPSVTVSDRDAQISQAVLNDHDPFDPLRVDQYVNPAATTLSKGAWRLIPVIYSAGPDGIYDISTGNYYDANGQLVRYEYRGNPYDTRDDNGNYKVGTPVDSKNDSVTNPQDAVNERLDHYDNITNHRIEGK
jgi:hypothetical protein